MYERKRRHELLNSVDDTQQAALRVKSEALKIKCDTLLLKAKEKQVRSLCAAVPVLAMS